MKNNILIFILFLSFKISFATTNQDSADKENLLFKIEQLENQVKEIRRDELNYQIEKDLLKESYTNNYSSISLIITIVLGFIGIFGYLGIRDISSIKKEYEKELSALRQIQGEFNSKVSQLDIEKKKFDDEIKSIIKENEEQSRKIKFIELKEKIHTLLKENNLLSALEFANAALDISPNDALVLNQKGRILCRLNKVNDALQVYEKSLAENPNDNSTKLNTAECLYFAKEVEKAKKMIAENKSLFESKDNGGLLLLFEIFDLFYAGNKEELIKKAKGLADETDLKSMKKRMDGWDLKEALYFAIYQSDTELKEILKNLLWFLDGQITGETLYQRLKIELPKTEKK